MSLLSRLRRRNSTTRLPVCRASRRAHTELKAALDQATEHFQAGNLKMAEAALALSRSIRFMPKHTTC